MSVLRVAAVMDTWAVSGPGRQIAALAGALRDNGVDLRLFLFQRADRERAPFFAYLDQAGLQYEVVPERRAFDPGAFRALGAALKNFAPDIVQSHHYKPTAFVLGHRLLGYRPPWISFFHGDTTENAKMRVYNRVHGWMVPLADRLVVLSQAHAARFAHVAAKVRLVPNAVLELPTGGATVDVASYRRPSVPVIGVLARLSHEKGVDLLIDALGRRFAAGREATLLVAGTGPEQGRLEAQARALGLADHVHFVGFCDDVVPFYRALDLVVLPSREGAEGMPNVLLEALRQDVPVAAAAVAGVPEVLSDPLAGELIRAGDVADMVRAIDAALAGGRSEASVQARAQAAARFSLARRVETHLALYRELVPRFTAAGA